MSPRVRGAPVPRVSPRDVRLRRRGVGVRRVRGYPAPRGVRVRSRRRDGRSVPVRVPRRGPPVPLVRHRVRARRRVGRGSEPRGRGGGGASVGASVARIGRRAEVFFRLRRRRRLARGFGFGFFVLLPTGFETSVFFSRRRRRRDPPVGVLAPRVVRPTRGPLDALASVGVGIFSVVADRLAPAPPRRDAGAVGAFVPAPRVLPRVEPARGPVAASARAPARDEGRVPLGRVGAFGARVRRGRARDVGRGFARRRRRRRRAAADGAVPRRGARRAVASGLFGVFTRRVSSGAPRVASARAPSEGSGRRGVGGGVRRAVSSLGAREGASGGAGFRGVPGRDARVARFLRAGRRGGGHRAERDEARPGNPGESFGGGGPESESFGESRGGVPRSRGASADGGGVRGGGVVRRALAVGVRGGGPRGRGPPGDDSEPRRPGGGAREGASRPPRRAARVPPDPGKEGEFLL